MSGGDWKEMLVAVQNGNIDLVKYHLSNGIDINYEHPELLTTALIESITYGHFDLTKYLLENGADPAQKAWISSDTPLKAAKQKGDKATITLIKSYLPKKKWFGLFG